MSTMRPLYQFWSGLWLDKGQHLTCEDFLFTKVTTVLFGQFVNSYLMMSNISGEKWLNSSSMTLLAAAHNVN